MLSALPPGSLLFVFLPVVTATFGAVWGCTAMFKVASPWVYPHVFQYRVYGLYTDILVMDPFRVDLWMWCLAGVHLCPFACGNSAILATIAESHLTPLFKDDSPLLRSQFETIVLYVYSHADAALFLPL